ncbi:hypothetical protein ACIB24_18940 [Spongisporangium articulatum]|uniref:Integral membrane protein n=1 Tax=Spongisporangium articulatum TaxID=3362603 RepID=A0ABW8ARY8_9ACTN
MSPDRGVARAGRVTAFTAAALTLAATAHVAAGGHLDLVLLPVLIPLVAALVDVAAARRLGPVALLALTGVVQLGSHLAFMAGATAPGSSMSSMPGMPGMDMPVSTTTAHTIEHAAHRSAGHDLVLPLDAMTATHAVAAVALALLLARGESALWALAAHLAWTFRLPRLPRPVPVAPPAAPVVPALRAPRPHPFLRTVSRRGPPGGPRAAVRTT